MPHSSVMDKQNLKAPSNQHAQEPVQQKPDAPAAPKEQPLQNSKQKTNKETIKKS